MKLLMILQLAELVSGQLEQSGLLQAQGSLQAQMQSTQSTLKMSKGEGKMEEEEEGESKSEEMTQGQKGEGKTGLLEEMAREKGNDLQIAKSSKEQSQPRACPKEVKKSLLAHFARLRDWVKAGEATIADIQDRDDLVACRKSLHEELDKGMTEEEHGEGLFEEMEEEEKGESNSEEMTQEQKGEGKTGLLEGMAREKGDDLQIAKSSKTRASPHACPKEVEKSVEAHFAKLHDWEKAIEAAIASGDIQDRDDLVECRKSLQEDLKSLRACPKEAQKRVGVQFAKQHDWDKAFEAAIASGDIQDREDLVACHKLWQEELKREEQEEQDEGKTALLEEEMEEEEGGKTGRLGWFHYFLKTAPRLIPVPRRRRTTPTRRRYCQPKSTCDLDWDTYQRHGGP